MGRTDRPYRGIGRAGGPYDGPDRRVKSAPPLPHRTAMPVDSELRTLDIDIPAQPEVLVQLSLLLAEDEVNLAAAAALIELDMALAAAVLKAVNSSMYGLRGRVQSVQQAITYLGTREVAAITFEMGLRAVFPPAPRARAGVAARRRARPADGPHRPGRSASTPWAAHSAGLFEECGKAVLFRHATERYRDDAARGRPTTTSCAARTRRLRRQPRHARRRAVRKLGPGAAGGRQRALPRHRPARASRCRSTCSGARCCALSAMAHALMTEPDTLDEVRARRAAGRRSTQRWCCAARARSASSWRNKPITADAPARPAPRQGDAHAAGSATACGMPFAPARPLRRRDEAPTPAHTPWRVQSL